VAVAAVLGIASGAARAEPSFTVVALPDTQFYSSTYPDTFTAQTNWIVNNKAAWNIVFVTHEGDLINTYTSSTEWSNAAGAMDNLNGVVPYGTAPGNHDTNGGNSYTDFLNNFGPASARFSGKTWYGGAGGPNSGSSYMFFQAGSRQFMALELDSNQANTSTLNWAQGILDAHKDMPTIVTMHDYLGFGGISSTGQYFWDNLVKLHGNSQVFMVLNGHTSSTRYQVDTDVDGKPVYEMLADYQYLYLTSNGFGYMRLITFDPDSSAIHIKTYSPLNGEGFMTDSANQFDITGVDFGRLPEPATLSMLALGALAIVRRARKAPSSSWCRPEKSGRQGQLLAPASHTTVRTVPYTAVHAEPLRRRCSWTRLTRPWWLNQRPGTAWFM